MARTTPEESLELLISASEIANRVDALAEDIVVDYGRDLVMVVILKGGFVFGADLLRALGRCGARVRLEFLGIDERGGTFFCDRPVPDVAGCRVLLVDDMLENAPLAVFAADAMRAQGAREVRLCVLLDKPARHSVEMAADYAGFAIADRHVAGYGIDCGDRHRERPDVAAMA